MYRCITIDSFVCTGISCTNSKSKLKYACLNINKCISVLCHLKCNRLLCVLYVTSTKMYYLGIKKLLENYINIYFYSLTKLLKMFNWYLSITKNTHVTTHNSICITFFIQTKHTGMKEKSYLHIGCPNG